MNNWKNDDIKVSQMEFLKKQFSKTGLNLKELGSLYTHVSTVANKKQEESALLCDRECQNNKKKEELYRKYVLAKQNYQTAPKEFEAARKNFYVINNGGEWFAKFLEKKNTKTIDTTLKLYQNTFNNKYDTIQEILKSHNLHTNYDTRLHNMGKRYASDNKNLLNDIDNIENRKNINNRMTYYYQEQIQYINYAIKFFKFLYWTLLGSFFIFVIFLQRGYMNARIITVSILFVIFPFLLDSIISFVTTTFLKTNVTIMK